MSKWKRTYGFPEPKVTLTPPRNLVNYANKIYQLDLKIDPDDTKLLTSYNYCIQRLFSRALKDQDFETVEKYLGMGVPTHFGKSLSINFIHNKYPLELIGLLISHTNNSSKALMSLIFHCATNSYVKEFIWLLDKMVSETFREQIIYVYDAYPNFFTTIIPQLIDKKYYILLQNISSEFVGDSSKRGNSFFKNFMEYEFMDNGILDEEEFYHIVCMLSAIGECKTACNLVNYYDCSLDILNNLLCYSATIKEVAIDQVNFRIYIQLLLTKGADYQHINLSTVANRHVFGIIGEIVYKNNYYNPKSFYPLSDQKKCMGVETIDSFLSLSHYHFYSSKELDIYDILIIGWKEMIYFLLNECDPGIKFVCRKIGINLLKHACRQGDNEILDLLLNNNRIKENAGIQGSTTGGLNHYTEATYLVCKEGRIGSLKILLGSVTARREILHLSYEFLETSYANSQPEIFDRLVADPSIKLMSSIDSDHLFIDQIEFRLWLIMEYLYQQYTLLELRLDPDAIRYLCQKYLDIL
jgi:hypothetical protein